LSAFGVLRLGFHLGAQLDQIRLQHALAKLLAHFIVALFLHDFIVVSSTGRSVCTIRLLKTLLCALSAVRRRHSQ
jgi:hypothetical protein